jgi:hypothetical protein
VREAKEVEGLRLSFPALLPTLLSVLPEFYQPRLLGVQLQREFLQPLAKLSLKPLGVILVLEALRRRSQTDPLSGGWEIHSRGLTAVASPEAGGLAVVVEQDDCLGMKLKRATPRRRCCECRSWYAPKPSTSKTQRTCSKACRLRRRGEREKARRAADLGAARKLERVRQRRHRERRKQTPGPQMSRAGLSVEARETIERIVEELGQLQRLSRAGLGRRLRGFLQGEAARAGLEVET